MRSRIIKSPGSATSDLRTTGCETMAWKTEVAEELNMDSNLCLPGGMIPGYFQAWQSRTVIKKTQTSATYDKWLQLRRPSACRHNAELHPIAAPSIQSDMTPHH